MVIRSYRYDQKHVAKLVLYLAVLKLQNHMKTIPLASTIFLYFRVKP